MEYQKFGSGVKQDKSPDELDFVIGETPKTFVIDASVCIKWFSSSKEENVDKAIILKNDFFNKNVYLIAPDLLLYEVTNALSYNPLFKRKDVSDAINSLEIMHLKFIKPLQQLLELALGIRFLKNISVYDSVYLALSKFTNSQFITADKKLFNIVNDLGNVIFLANY
jgi:predicted nucleic acid-binding protein